MVTEIGEQITAHAKQRAQNAGARNVTTHICAGDIADEILDMAEVEKAGILVPDHRGLGRARETLFGSVSQKVLHHSYGEIGQRAGGGLLHAIVKHLIRPRKTFSVSR